MKESGLTLPVAVTAFLSSFSDSVPVCDAPVRKKRSWLTEESPCETCNQRSVTFVFFIFTLYLQIFFHRREKSRRFSLPVIDV